MANSLDELINNHAPDTLHLPQSNEVKPAEKKDVESDKLEAHDVEGEVEKESKAKKLPAKPPKNTGQNSQSVEIADALERIETTLKNDEAARKSIEGVRKDLTELVDSFNNLLQVERKKFLEQEAMVNRLEDLYAKELSVKRRSTVPILWWRLLLANLVGSVLTVALLFFVTQL